MVALFSGVSPAEVTGNGTGIDAACLAKKIGLIEKAITINRPDPEDPLDVLAKVGGFEIGGIAGLILGAASERKPVLIDGFIATAAALVAARLAPLSAGYMIASHLGMEKGHGIALKCLGKAPLLHLDLRLGEGTGSVLAMNLVDASVRLLTDVPTFEEASVSRANM